MKRQHVEHRHRAGAKPLMVVAGNLPRRQGPASRTYDHIPPLCHRPIAVEVGALLRNDPIRFPRLLIGDNDGD